MYLGTMGQKSETILWRFCGLSDTHRITIKNATN